MVVPAASGDLALSTYGTQPSRGVEVNQHFCCFMSQLALQHHSSSRVIWTDAFHHRHFTIGVMLQFSNNNSLQAEFSFTIPHHSGFICYRSPHIYGHIHTLMYSTMFVYFYLTLYYRTNRSLYI